MTPFDQVEREMWAGTADAYEAAYAKLCAHTVPELLDSAQVAAGTRVLDVGTGPGTVARAAADRGAAVTAVDAEPSMVALAQRRVPEATVVHAIVPDLPFPDAAFDAVVGNFVLNHFGRPKVALAELLRVAQPGARVALSLWPAASTPGRTLIRRSMEAVPGVVFTEMPQLDPVDDYPRTRDGFIELLSEAGLRDVGCVQLDWDHLSTLDEWWSSIPNGVAGSARVYLRQPADLRARIHEEFVRLASEMLDAAGRLVLPQTALVGFGTV